MEPWEENGEELIDGSGRNVTQQRIDEEAVTQPAAGEDEVAFEPDGEWFDEADPKATAS